MAKRKVDLVTVLGHTAAGKTAFAAQLASQIDGEIVSADSRQVYRGMDIGTGKDYGDYMVNGERIPCHLIDITDAGYEYNVYLFKQDFQRTYTDIIDRGKVPVLCGGTGLYIESVLRNYQLLHVPINRELREDLEKKGFEELVDILKLYGPQHNITDTGNRKRMIRAIEIAMYQGTQPQSNLKISHLNPLIIGIKYNRENRRRRITERLKQRLENGMIDEVAGLLNQGISPGKMDYYGLEYRFVSRYILHEITYDEMVWKLNTAIHQFAKRQMTYFRGMEKRGLSINWLDGELSMEEKIGQALSLYRTACIDREPST